jgi:hypothetical protein
MPITFLHLQESEIKLQVYGYKKRWEFRKEGVGGTTERIAKDQGKFKSIEL